MKNLSNSVTLIGRAGSDPMIKAFDNDNKLCSFSMALNEFFINTKGEKVERTHWFRVVAWGRLAEMADQQIKKGNMFIVLGRLSNRSYTTKEGEKKSITEIIAEEIYNLSAQSAEAIAA